MEILSPAKINLYLEVVGKRPDGYHDIRSLMCPVSLYDTVRIRMGGDSITLVCDAPGVPADETNLAWRAADVFSDALRRKGRASSGMSIELEKRIPVGGGLGGGSSNAASVLLALNRHWHHPFSPEEMARLGFRLGADVPFFLLGKPALASGVGERLEPFDGLAARPVLIVAPGFSISTSAVYGALNLALTKCRKRHKNSRFRERKFEVPGDLCNDLETVVEPRYPVISSVKKALMDCGAQGALLSGSGSCVFGLFADAAGARRAFAHLSQSRKWRSTLVDMIV
ncbi:MAG: 4-(cytidine 5'-diphospho)-2-C-methyl-D-erythritol kinase [Desulfobacterales bacterium]|nr:4-(cytidine 5'-diphospho)-2-C-methyl-D-erythritol kinase [Desulfobacterales bacterium]